MQLARGTSALRLGSSKLASTPRALQSISRKTSTIMTAAAPPRWDVVVKGEPEIGKLADCPFCHRVLLTLHAKGVPYNMTYVDFAHKPQWLLDASQGKVPVIREPATGMVMPDSDKIVVMLEEKYPSPSMTSDVPPEIGAKLFPAFRGYLTSHAGDADEAEKRAAVVAELKLINDYLSQAGKGPLFGGSSLNMTDAAVAPKLYHVQVALKHFKKFDIPAELKAVHKYLEAVRQLDAWKACDYGEEMIIKGWGKHH